MKLQSHEEEEEEEGEEGPAVDAGPSLILHQQQLSSTEEGDNTAEDEDYPDDFF